MRKRLVIRIMIGGVALVVLGVVGWVVYAPAMSGSRTFATVGSEVDRMAWQAAERQLSAEAEAVGQRYHELLANGGEDPVLSGRLDLAIRQLEELIRRNPQAGGECAQRLEKLEEARDTLMARAVLPRIVALETKANAAPDISVAIEARREALALQQQINRSFAHAQWKDFVRETRLAMQLAAAEAAPLRELADAALAEAETAVSQERWTEALAAYERGRTALTEINVRYPGTRFADIARLDRITAEITALEPAGAAREVAEREQAAETAQAAGRMGEAMALFASARNQQRELNARYPRSRFVSVQRVNELESRRQTVGAQDLLERAVAIDGEAAALLFGRRVIGAAAKVEEASALLKQLARDFPLSRVQPGALKLKLAYLTLRRGALAALQDQVYAQLEPVPGEKNLLMPDTMVSQALFVSVMNTNPSRQTGPDLPVDAVDSAGVQEFCRRLSWLLGTPVRLPTERESLHAGDGKMNGATNRGGFSFVVEYPLPVIFSGTEQ